MTEKEFEKQFNELFDNPEDEAKAAAQLAKEEAEIDKENQLFAEGKAHYKEGKKTNNYLQCNKFYKS